MTAIAEAGETSNQATHLRTLGCEAAQGYFFAKPVHGGIAAFLMVQTAMFRLAEVMLPRDRTEPSLKAEILSCKSSQNKTQ